MAKHALISLVISMLYSTSSLSMGGSPMQHSLKLRPPSDRAEINNFSTVRDPTIADEKSTEESKLVWIKDIDKEYLGIGKGIERQVWFGKKGRDPDHLVGIWLNNKSLFPQDFLRLESMFKYSKIDSNVSSATSMRRTAEYPRAALVHFDYKGYIASGGGLNGKPTGLFHTFRSKIGKDFLILQDLDLKVTEGGRTMTRELINARVRNRPAVLFYIEQSTGALFDLDWTYDGFYRRAELYCANAAKCDYKAILLKIANDWD